MAITRYSGRTDVPSFWRTTALSPWRELDALTDRVNRIFGESLVTNGETMVWNPPINVEETGDEVVITAELPGMKEEDVEIELENNVLTIRGEKREERTEGAEDRRYHLWERRYGSFQRSFTLPRAVDHDGISADFAAGVLEIRMPKTEEARGRKIQIGGRT